MGVAVTDDALAVVAGAGAAVDVAGTENESTAAGAGEDDEVRRLAAQRPRRRSRAKGQVSAHGQGRGRISPATARRHARSSRAWASTAVAGIHSPWTTSAAPASPVTATTIRGQRRRRAATLDRSVPRPDDPVEVRGAATSARTPAGAPASPRSTPSRQGASSGSGRARKPCPSSKRHRREHPPARRRPDALRRPGRTRTPAPSGRPGAQGVGRDGASPLTTSPPPAPRPHHRPLPARAHADPAESGQQQRREEQRHADGDQQPRRRTGHRQLAGRRRPSAGIASGTPRVASGSPAGRAGVTSTATRLVYRDTR